VLEVEEEWGGVQERDRSNANRHRMILVGFGRGAKCDRTGCDRMRAVC
jgi:hypothetical protein